MSNKMSIQSISSGYRSIQDGSRFDQFFGFPDEKDRVIIKDGEVEDTVELMKKVVWKYLDDTKKIATYLKGRSVAETCENIWNFLYNHVQYKLDQKGLEQLHRPSRSWSERETGIDCDCFSIFVSSILTNLKIAHRFRITKYDQGMYQHVYVVVPKESGSGEYIIDCVLSRFNYEKPYTAKKDFTMSLNGINVAVLSGTTSNVMDLVNDLEGLENLGADSQQERLSAIYDHLVKTRNIIAGKPQLIQNVDYPPAFLKMLDYAIENWNTPSRDKALAILAQNEDALNKHYQLDLVPENSDLEGLDNDWSEMDDMSDEELLGMLGGKKRKEKKQAKAEKKAAKKADPTKKGFFKKVGEAVKKGGKAFIRYNPVTVAARNGFLLALKLNIKKMGSKLKWGYATKEQAAAKGITADKWEKSKNAVAKVEKLFADKLQGKRDKLKNAILKGKAGGLSGTAESEFNLTGLGAAPAAAALAAAVPVIASCLKIMVESGIMSQDEADNLQMDVDANVAEGDKMMETDPDFNADTTDDGSGDSGDDGSGEGGFFGWVTRNPVIAIGAAGLAVWGVSKVLSGKKKASGAQNLSGPQAPAKKKAPPKQKKSKANARAQKAKIKAIKLS
ncbi:MAG: hypothetical protein A2W93_03555 [Bacteroidetes bacterium GWF2_43_63]|nr:MAG: hypothetical protein A2W93_03555 [Bacteroidetes bacterium GWF2_43_63]HBG70504.1 hypothetical protein [Bacteroidales bacterium]HCB61499.1 hypothetical protein [Bacteroidales bacterium]